MTRESILDTSLNGRVALITGGSKGLGFAMAKAYFSQGAKVALLARGADDLIAAQAEGIALARDLINTPAGDLGPRELAAAARDLAGRHSAKCTVIAGKDLLKQGYPAVHAVGRAADNGPRLIDITWGKVKAPRVTLVGKGVCFDTGGLDLKPSSAMLNMKKDMGGSAQALGLAYLIMANELPVRLRVLIPAVENSVSGRAFRPKDIIQTRAGLSVEIGNTDAEGRLILADALTRAGEHSPDLTLDFATLTGAARIALGPELPPLYTDDEALAADLLAAGRAVGDPLWRMPLWPGYRAALDTEIADIKNDASAWAQAGSVTAALFLQRFAPASGAWAHMDIFAWNPRARPGFPEGGEAQAIRACYAVLKARYGG